MADAVVQRITLHPLLIPLRRKWVHAAAERGVADPVVVCVEFTDGAVGFGETVPRRYVTGETVDSVLETIQEVYARSLLGFHPKSFPDALELIEALPWSDVSGARCPAARAGVEMALLDAAMRSFRRTVQDVVQWMGLPGFGAPGSVGRIRFSGVLACEDTPSTIRQLRSWYWRGLRDFKLHVGLAGDRDRLAGVVRYLSKPLARGKASLRIDATGAWSLSEAIAWFEGVGRVPLSAVEQPLEKSAVELLPNLLGVIHSESFVTEGRDGETLPLLMHDESLVTLDDARGLFDAGVAGGFSIGLSKCGGLLPSLRIAAFARRNGIALQLGCLEGETSILSAAGLGFLAVCPGVRWAEGCLGSHSLRQDVVGRGLRFGYGGRPPALESQGLSPSVSVKDLGALNDSATIVLNF